MNEIIEQARVLGNMLAESREMKRYREAESRQIADEAAQELLARYQAARADITERMRTEEKMTPDKLRAFQAEIREAVEMLSGSETVTEYLDAKSDFTNLMSQVNSVISYCVTGEETQGASCGGNCGSCGGCH